MSSRTPALLASTACMPPFAERRPWQSALIGDVLPLSRKDSDKYIVAHIVATAERLRGDMAGLDIFVQKAEVLLRDLIHWKSSADRKLSRDDKQFQIMNSSHGRWPRPQVWYLTISTPGVTLLRNPTTSILARLSSSIPHCYKYLSSLFFDS